jgi:hypothetical protein
MKELVYKIYFVVKINVVIGVVLLFQKLVGFKCLILEWI